MINLTFQIDENAFLDYSDSYLSKSFISKNTKIIDNINLSISNNLLDNKYNIKDSWDNLCHYINENDFYVKNVLALRKGESFKKFRNNETNEFRNIVINLNSKALNLKYNQISFYVDLKNENDQNSLNEFKIYLKRIEFLKINNFQKSINEQVYLDKLIFNNNHVNDIEGMKKIIREIKFIFDNNDYDQDKVAIKEWNDFIYCIWELYKNKKNEQKTNFVLNFNDRYILFSKNEINKISEYQLYNEETNANLDKEISWEIKKYDNFDNEINNTRNKLIEWIDNNEKLFDENGIKIKQYYKEIDDIKKDIAILNNETNELLSKKNQIDKKIKDCEEKSKIEVFNKKQLISDIKTIEQKIDLKNIEKNNKENNQTKIETEINVLEDKNENLEKSNNTYKKRIKIYEDFLNFYKEYKYKYHLTSKNKNNVNFYSLNNIEELNSNVEDFYFANEDNGTKVVVNRMRNALSNIEKGYYKNPEFYLGIKDVDKLKIVQKNDLDEWIINKYDLNNKQKEAISKSINTDSVFYLQGPPGTGKTQTICAISDWVINNNMSLVMTSSTHEAINNFFDRFSDFNTKNPNLIDFKFRNTKTENKDKLEDELKHGNASLYKKFKWRIKNNVISNNQLEIIDKLQETLNTWDQTQINEIVNFYLNKKFIPLPIVDLIFKNWNNKVLRNQFMDNNEDDILWRPIYDKTENENNHSRFIKSWEQTIAKSDIDKSTFEKFDDLLKLHIHVFNELKNEIDVFKFNNNYFNEINNLISKNKRINKNMNLESLLLAINDNYKDKNDDYENEFLDYIIDNQLINVIGVTTTSENKIKLNGREIFLYNEYPIDYMIVDEISKSSTPEILSKAILAKKVIFVGDYLQLPPSSNLNNDKILNYLKEKEWNGLKEKNAIEAAITDLFKKSFFKIQVNKIKNNYSNDNLPYCFLNESHRFGKKIMDIVNVIYPNDEKLILPKNNNESNIHKINLNISNKNLDCEAVMINLLKPTNNFCKKYDFNLKINDNGFDQSGGKLFASDKLLKFDGTYNEYSAYVITRIVKKLKEDNSSFFDKNKRIGIITLTKNQKQLIKNTLSKEHLLENIKVDTIDNFQGREEEVIIVDFIRGETKIENNKLIQSKKRNTSFLSEKEKINVAVSRAKKKLILVGFYEYLKTLKSEGCDYLSQYYEILKYSNDSYIEWTNECEEE